MDRSKAVEKLRRGTLQIHLDLLGDKELDYVKGLIVEAFPSVVKDEMALFSDHRGNYVQKSSEKDSTWSWAEKRQEEKDVIELTIIMMNNVRRPEEIQKEIEALSKELSKSKEKYEYRFLCDSHWSDDMIGFFNMSNGRKILELLNQGRELQYRHAVYGNVDVYMNPQRNRIIVSDNKDITEQNILTFVFWATGDWYLKMIDL